jgi:hypothetical protein
MIQNLPIYISLIFGLTTLATLAGFYWVVKNSTQEITRRNANKILAGLIGWLAIQAFLSLGNVYHSNPEARPPRIFVMGVLPVLLTIIILFGTQQGRRFTDSLPLLPLTWLNVVRIPVEGVLFWLFLHKAIPEIMTFEGRNFDIFAGITAPFIAIGIMKGKINKQVTLAWHFICLGLLINIMVIAFLSAPSPFQKLAFDQPNIAVLHYPFSWLASFVAPLVLFGHLVSIRKILKGRLDEEFPAIRTN